MIPNLDQISVVDLSPLDFVPDKKRFLFLARKDKVDFVYNTAALEGNAMTFPEVATLLDGVTVGGHKLSDEQQILNQNRSVELLYQLLYDDQFVVNKETLCLLHGQVAKDEALTWGQFRDGNVNIGGSEYLPPSADKLDEIFTTGVAAIGQIEHPIVAALTYFLFGARTQFFYDGNKRVSRLTMNGMLLANGYPMLNIKAKDKLRFNQQMILFYDTADYGVVLEYLRDYYVQQNQHIR
jgi:Fic family protein